jgi:hypothetical protein
MVSDRPRASTPLLDLQLYTLPFAHRSPQTLDKRHPHPLLLAPVPGPPDPRSGSFAPLR